MNRAALVLALLSCTGLIAGSAQAQETQTGAEKPTELPTELAPSPAIIDAKPAPWLQIRQVVGVAGWPTGLISDSRLQLRAPLHRSDSIVFQDTYAGVGARLRVTPAFIDVGPRFSFAPIDIFDMDVQASFVGYWPSSSGLLPYDSVDESTLDRLRDERQQDPDTASKPGTALNLSLVPTLKAKVGPVIILDGWEFSYYHLNIDSSDKAPLHYEPFWDRRLAKDNLVFNHEAVILFEALDGADRPKLMFGPIFNHRWTLISGDSTMQLGGILLLKPSPKPSWPMFVVQVKGYLKDEDRFGGPPSMALAAVWNIERGIRPALAAINPVP